MDSMEENSGRTAAVIRNLGLTRVESGIYLAILELGSAMAGDISRKTGVHRRSVYDAIERLVEKGMVSYIKMNSRRYFEAVHPGKLAEMMDEKKREIEEILPQLEGLYRLQQEKKETQFFKGKQGLMNVFDHQLKEKKEILVIGASEKSLKTLNYYFIRYDRIRRKKKIRMRMLVQESSRGKIQRPAYCSIRYLPKGIAAHTTTEVYGDNTAIIFWSSEPFAVLITQKEIADDYKQYFKIMWDAGKK